MTNVLPRRRRSSTRTLVTTTAIGVLAVAAILTGENISARPGASASELVSNTKTAVAAPVAASLASPFGTPAQAADSDAQAVELGTAFHVSVAGAVSGVTFDKSTMNTGIHTGTLWDSTGARLATTTFAGETASGWQTAQFATPVTVVPGRTYTVSFHTNAGHYFDNVGAFSGGATIAVGSMVETMGVYHYGATSGFPSSSWESSNYLVGPIFTTSTIASAAPATPTPSPVAPTHAPTPTPSPVAPTHAPTRPKVPGTHRGSTTPVTTASAAPAPTPTHSTAAPTPVVTADPVTGWPDASNTGVPAGTKLTPSGTITVTKAGTVISGMDVSGCIIVQANNVTIKDTRVRHSGCGDRFNIDTGTGQYSGTVIEDVEVDGQDENTGQDDGIGFAGFTCIRCNIHDIGQGANIYDGVNFQDSWIHNLHEAAGEHIEDIVSNGGSNMTFVHNNLDAVTTTETSSALSLYGDFDPIQNVVIKDNLLNGGSYCLYAGGSPGKAYPIATNVSVTGNVFGNEYFPKCGMFGTSAGFSTNVGNVWSGNTTSEGATVGSS